MLQSPHHLTLISGISSKFSQTLWWYGLWQPPLSPPTTHPPIPPTTPPLSPPETPPTRPPTGRPGYCGNCFLYGTLTLNMRKSPWIVTNHMSNIMHMIQQDNSPLQWHVVHTPILILNELDHPCLPHPAHVQQPVLNEPGHDQLPRLWTFYREWDSPSRQQLGYLFHHVQAGLHLSILTKGVTQPTLTARNRMICFSNHDEQCQGCLYWWERTWWSNLLQHY